MLGSHRVPKRITRVSIWLAALLCAGLSAHAQAASQYYTFQGTVTSLSDSDGLIGAAGLSLNSSVQYVFEVDFGLDATFTQMSGNVITQSDPSTQDYYFANYVSGSALPVPASPLYTAPTNVAEYNRGSDFNNGTAGILTTNSQNNQLTLRASGNTISGLSVGDGTSLRVDNRIWYSGGANANTAFLVSTDMVLTSISNTAPVTAVPEPEIYAMMGVGLGLMGWVARRKKLKPAAA